MLAEIPIRIRSHFEYQKCYMRSLTALCLEGLYKAIEKHRGLCDIHGITHVRQPSIRGTKRNYNLYFSTTLLEQIEEVTESNFHLTLKNQQNIVHNQRYRL